jgi:putative ABC transport system permease protein
MGTLWQDLKYGLRMLRKNPGFTAAAVITLALGIGLNTAIFSVVNAVLFKPLPVERPEELAAVYNTAKEGFLTHEPMAYLDYADLREQSKSFSGLVGYGLDAYAVESGDESQFVLGDEVTGNFFTTLGIRAVRGRVFTAEEDQVPGAHPVMVISYHSWQRRFGSHPNIVGRVVRVNGTPLTIIGVAEPRFTGLLRGLQSELFVPMMMSKVMGRREQLESRRARWMFVMGRLKPGVSFAQANAEVETIGRQLALAYPETNETRNIGLLPASDVRILPGVDRVLYATSFVLLGVVGLVLLIASANVANMLLARATARRKEIAVRLAIGASRWRLVRQLLVESSLLALGGGAGGLLVAGWSNVGLNAALSSSQMQVPIEIALGLAVDFRVIGYTLALATLAAVLFGLAPALGASRTDLAAALKDEDGTTSAGHGRRRLGNALVVAQVSLSLVLLIGAGLSVRSLLNADRIDPGFRAQGAATAMFAAHLRGYTPEQVGEFSRRLLESVRAMPGVERAAMASHLPLVFEIRTTNVMSEAQSALPVDEWPDMDTAFVGPGYFETMGIPILRGRGFRDDDGNSKQLYVVVNEALAKNFWPGQDALGQRVVISKQRVRRSLEDEGRIAEVVGIARDSKYRTLGEAPRPYLYQSNVDRPLERDALIVRASSDPRALLPAIRQQARNIDSMVPVISLRTLDEATSAAMLFPRAGAALFGLFGVLGLVLASVGLYGVLAYAVSQRTHEIGIRMALGAQPRDILKLIVGQGLALTLVGVVIGLAGAFAATRIIGVLLYGISPTDVPTFAGVSLVLLGVALAACWIPARRAARVEPMEALRYE